MKRTRLNTITDLTKNDKVKAIKRVNSLIDDGLTLNKARNAVASELELHLLGLHIGKEL